MVAAIKHAVRQQAVGQVGSGARLWRRRRRTYGAYTRTHCVQRSVRPSVACNATECRHVKRKRTKLKIEQRPSTPPSTFIPSIHPPVRQPKNESVTITSNRHHTTTTVRPEHPQNAHQQVDYKAGRKQGSNATGQSAVLVQVLLP